MLNKITDGDLAGKGVIGLPDVPGLPTEEMQAKFEETAREVIVPKFNGLVNQLASSTAASELGAIDPTTKGAAKVQDALNSLNEKMANIKVEGYAPERHASVDDKYGSGSNVAYGHVKLSDEVVSNVSDDDGTAATPRAVWLATSDVVRYSAQGAMGYTEDQKAEARRNIGAAKQEELLSVFELATRAGQTAVGAQDSVDALELKSVKTVYQSLTEVQKRQARENIGAAAVGGPDKSVLYEAQELDINQKAQARANIGAPAESHSDTTDKYGAASRSRYGHVKIQDEINTNATSGVAASPEGVAVAVENAKKELAPKDHSSSGIGYGAGNGTLYGHVKLSDSTYSSSSMTDGVAATPKAVSLVKETADEAQKAARDAQEAAGRAEDAAGEAKAKAEAANITEYKSLAQEQRNAARVNIAAVSYEADQGLNNFARYNARTNIKAVSYEAAPQTPLTEEEKEQARKNIGAAAEGETGAKNAVTYTEQTLTESEKVQARKNIGAASPADLTAATEKAVTYDSTQTLTTAQQAAARENIGAAPTSHVDGSGNYGKATASMYGHVLLINNADKDSAGNGRAVTPYALWKETSNRVSVEAQELTEEQKAQARANIGAAPTNHASLDKDLYGVGGGSKYGHVKLSGDIGSDADENGGTAATPHAVKTVYDWAFGQNKENVKITAQTLTDAQKAQARANIGAAAVGEGGGWVQPDWEAAEGVDGHIKNRTHWKDWEYVEVVPIKDVHLQNVGTVPYGVDATTGAYANVVEGSKVSVYWDGKWYNCTAFVSGGSVSIGNYSVISSTAANTGEPFFLQKASADRMRFYPKIRYDSYSYGLKLAEPVYHKLPKEYLPDDIGGGATPDWNAAEGEPGHILHRPFYTEGGAVILEEMEVSNKTDDGISENFTKHLGLEVGETYTVVCGGVAYECVGRDLSTILGIPAVGLGNLSIMGLAGNGEPFVLVDTANEIDPGVYGMVMTSEVTTIAIYYAETVHKLPSKFLPDGVPYVEKGEPVVVLPATEAYSADDGLYIDVFAGVIEAGQTFIINYNGTDYKCIAQDFSANGEGTVAFGNLGAIGKGENTGEPFAIAYSPSYAQIAIFPLDGASSVTLSVTWLPERMNKLDPRLLPDGVLSEVLIVKGSADMRNATHTPDSIRAACYSMGKACFFVFEDKVMPLCSVRNDTGQARFSLVFTDADGNLLQSYVVIESDGTISDYANDVGV